MLARNDRLRHSRPLIAVRNMRINRAALLLLLCECPRTATRSRAQADMRLAKEET